MDDCAIDENFEILNTHVALSFDDLGLERLDLVFDAANLRIFIELPQQALVILQDLVLHLPLLQKVVRRAHLRKFLLNVMYLRLEFILR